MLRRSGKFVIVGLFGGDATFARVSMPFRMAPSPGLLCRLIAGIPLVRAGRIDGMPHATCALKAANDVLKELRQS